MAANEHREANLLSAEPLLQVVALADDLRVEADRGVVDERAAVDFADVDAARYGRRR